jgi:cytidylate kinase
VLVQNNDLDKLQQSLAKINAYSNQSVFQKHKKEVEKLEHYLFSTNLAKYRELVINSLQEALKVEPFPVLVEELKEVNRDFVSQVNQLTDQSALENIKNEVLDNVGEKKAEKLVNNLLVQIQQNFASEEERSVVCQTIYRLRDNGNS